MGLRVVKVCFTEVHGIEAGVHIALERQQGLLGIFGGKGGRPAAEACCVKA